MKKKLYLKIGDSVQHIRHSARDKGEVIEEKHSSLSGGSCLVRILFEDGIERSFINDIDKECCCCYSGIKIIY